MSMRGNGQAGCREGNGTGILSVKDDGLRLYVMDTQQLADGVYFQACYSRLSAARRAKTDGYRCIKDKRLSLGVGILLDRGLREYGLKESDVRIERGKNGKPYLPEHPQIHFNLSHSGHMALAAFADAEVGCDIEDIKEADLELAKQFFRPEEYELLSGLKGEEQNSAFFQLWTLKESFLKATGMGMELPLNTFGFYLSDGRIEVQQSYDKLGYRFRQYRFGRYWAAVCIQGHSGEVI